MAAYAVEYKEYVYVCYSPSTGLYKIGETRKEPTKRANAIADEQKEDLIMNAVHVHSSFLVEYIIHKMLAKFKVEKTSAFTNHREWFNIRGNYDVIISKLIDLIIEVNNRGTTIINKSYNTVISHTTNNNYHLEDHETNIGINDEIQSDNESVEDSDDEWTSDSDDEDWTIN